ncbi:iron complex transport system permease protein [Sinobacterium caligoides]|uniref:Iron complex transport system permease protein n=1 Tax=Sinobacterium caligoides TaxID=933926 RepID=A0A3N2DZU6_9GAMM|nr:iron ABC transporter permease [Sinobacterium caligoides]ROS04835.1 iron complex transport system permease protein [Sinobacterium caligoides]
MKLNEQSLALDRDRYLIVGLSIVLSVLVAVSLMTGEVSLTLQQLWQALMAGDSSINGLVVVELRLPRTLLALIVGAGLAACGAALQGLLRNPLASPELLGVSSCSALGAVLVLYFGLANLHWMMMPAAGVLGGLIAVVAVLLLSGVASGSLILAGVAINALAGSLLALALYLAPNPFALNEMVLWLMGSLANRSLSDVFFVLPFMTLGFVLLFSCGRLLDAMTLGEETANSLGVAVHRQRLMLIIGVAMIVGAGVSVSGNIAFIGLVVPHLMRPLVAYQPSRLLPVSALSGAALLLAADIASRSIGSQPLQVGVVTTLMGAPFFLYLVVRQRGQAQW